MDDNGFWMREFKCDSEAAFRIAETVETHNMSLRDAADILDVAALLCDELTPRGAVDRIRALMCGTLICKPPERLEGSKATTQYVDEIDCFGSPSDTKN